MATPAAAQPPGGTITYHFETVHVAQLVSDINPGPAHAVSIPFGLAPRQQYGHGFQGGFYFQADDGASGAELWRTTGDGATLVADIAPGPAGSAPHAFAVFQNALYFAASTPATGEELFRYDGTSVTLAADISPGPNGATIGGLTVYGGALYFTRRVQGGDPQVWRFDGTSAQPVIPINQSLAGAFSIEGGVRSFAVFQNRLFYIVKRPLPHRYALWAYNGTQTTKIANLTSVNDISERAFDLGVYNNALYYGVVAPGPQSSPWMDQLWRYNGTSPPQKIGDLGSAWSFSQPVAFVTYKGSLYFTTGCKLWRYSVVFLQEVNATSPSAPTCAQQLSGYTPDQLFLSGYTGNWTFAEPHLFDGISATLIRNIMPDSMPMPGSFPTFATPVGDRLYFFAEDAEHGRELWTVAKQNVLHLYATVGLLWDDKLRWPVAEHVRELVLATYLVVERQAPRLVSRQPLSLPAEPEVLRIQVLEIDRRRHELASEFALVSVLFDRRTGEKLDVGVNVFGLPARDARAAMERAGATHGHRVEFRTMMSSPIQELDQVRPVRQ